MNQTTIIPDFPEIVKVAAFDFTIEQWNHNAATSTGRFGDCSPNELLIRVDTSLNIIKVIDTLVHEINHAVFWAYGLEDEDKEERVVATMATAWVQIYRDNPGLIPFIQQLIDKYDSSIT